MTDFTQHSQTQQGKLKIFFSLIQEQGVKKVETKRPHEGKNKHMEKVT